MSFIDYEALAAITDKRIVKSRRSIFESLITLLGEKPLSQITVTELCGTALINRKTFYTQFTSVEEAFQSLEKHIIDEFLKKLQINGILSRSKFKPDEYIIFADRCRRDNIDSFNVLYPYFRNGDFLRQYGSAVGNLGNQYLRETPSIQDAGIYSSALVFSICGLATFYFDWLDLGMLLSLEELTSLAETIMTVPLNECMNVFDRQ